MTPNTANDFVENPSKANGCINNTPKTKIKRTKANIKKQRRYLDSIKVK
jgi:hypothetical protein